MFSFGRAATSSFNTKLSKGQARLDFARPENREFWLAGYHYIKSLIQKGTYRTAFEWAKLLLSLDPEGDPYKMGLVLHELALRAGENKWLIDLCESQLPLMWLQEEERTRNATSHTIPSCVLAALNLKDGTKSRELLRHYMQTLPWLFVQLFSELNLQAPPSIWGILPRNDSEKLLTELYVLQTKDLWNTTEATALLMEIAHSLPKADHSKFEDMLPLTVDLNVVRFVYLEDNRNIMALAPSHILHQDSTDWDPYPPQVNIFSYDSQRIALGRSTSLADDAGLNAYHPLEAIFRMFPGRRPDDPSVPDDESDVSTVRTDVDSSPETTRGLISRALEFVGWTYDERTTSPFGHHEETRESSHQVDDTDEPEIGDDPEDTSSSRP